MRGPLHGIPVVVKDNYDTGDMPTSAGAIGLATSVPPDDATQVRRLREAGAIILGKTNMHELARGITTVSSLTGQTRNPYDPTRNPGGSSGGTGAAVAASFGAVGMGSDTCGSIRIPSAHHALVGLRGTRGLASGDGIVPLSTTQDIGGPLARSVEDLAITLDATVGPDPADAVTARSEGRIPASFRDALDPDALQGARLAVLNELLGDSGAERPVSEVIEAGAEAMAAAGAEIVDIGETDLEVVPGGRVGDRPRVQARLRRLSRRDPRCSGTHARRAGGAGTLPRDHRRRPPHVARRGDPRHRRLSRAAGPAGGGAGRRRGGGSTSTT